MYSSILRQTQVIVLLKGETGVLAGFSLGLACPLFFAWYGFYEMKY